LTKIPVKIFVLQLVFGYTPGFFLGVGGSFYSIFSFLCSVLYIIVCHFSFGHCFVCPSSIYWFWLPLWYLQTLLIHQIDYSNSSAFSTNRTKWNNTILYNTMFKWKGTNGEAV